MARGRRMIAVAAIMVSVRRAFMGAIARPMAMVAAAFVRSLAVIIARRTVSVASLARTITIPIATVIAMSPRARMMSISIAIAVMVAVAITGPIA